MTTTTSRKLQHYTNPLHVMCFLHRLGLPIRKAQFVSTIYENAIFNPCIRKFDAKKPETITRPDPVGRPVH